MFSVVICYKMQLLTGGIKLYIIIIIIINHSVTLWYGHCLFDSDNNFLLFTSSFCCLCHQVEVIGHSVFDLVHPRDRRELQDVTGNRYQNSVTRSHAACNHRLFIRMKCHMITKGHLLPSQSPAYRVSFTLFIDCDVTVAEFRVC